MKRNTKDLTDKEREAYNVIKKLRNANMKKIADGIDLHRANALTRVRALIEKGLVERVDDGRKVFYRLIK